MSAPRLIRVVAPAALTAATLVAVAAAHRGQGTILPLPLVAPATVQL
jgi:hypothetical protein